MNHAPRLHIVHTEASAGWGGQEIRILAEAQGMVERGHQVTLLTPAHTRIHAEALNRDLPVVDLPLGRKNLKGVLALRRWLRQNPVDVINSHSSTDSWLSALARSQAGPALVRTRHISAPVPNNWASRWLYRRASAHVVTTGEALRRHLIEDVGCAPDHVTSVPTGIDTERFRPGDKAAARAALGLPTESRYLGIVATLRSWKGHSFLLQALAQLPGDLQLLIVGDGPQREALTAQVQELGLGERAHMVGDQADVVPWLQSLDLFALPSWANEGVPQALLQAMACGLPVVSTPVGGIPELVEDGITGALVAPRDAAALAAGLEGMLAAPARAEELAGAARARVVARHGLEGMLERMEAIFREACG